jgi:hypothetical protein
MEIVVGDEAVGGKEISDGCEAHCDSVICTSPSSSSTDLLVSSASPSEGSEDSTSAAPDPIPHSPPGGAEAGTEPLDGGGTSDSWYEPVCS